MSVPPSAKSWLQYLPVAIVAISVVISFTQLQGKAEAQGARIAALEQGNIVVYSMANDIAAMKTDVTWLKKVFEKYDIIVQR